MNPKNTEEEYWLALLRAPGVGPVKFARLVEHFGNPRGVFDAEWSEWQALKMKKELFDYLQNPDWHAIEKDMQWLAQSDNYLLTWEHPDYPPLLREIDDPPPVLFVHGDYTLLSSHQLAMVGTRHPTKEGEQTAREFAEHLTFQGFTITSGMAYGIDGASHWGALAGTGKTIAVAGTGLDRVYPAGHRELAHKIAQNGALVSELPLGTQVRRRHFPIRSRVVSGLSLGTLVVEAPQESGALYTARHAIKQGRKLFAIPGSIHNPSVRGCHQLIKKEGAKLVEKATDILEELQIHRPLTAAKAKKNTPLPSFPPSEKVPTHSTTTSSFPPLVPEEQTTNCQKTGLDSLASELSSYHSSQDSKSHGVDISADQSSLKGSALENNILTTESDLDNDYLRLLDYLKAGPTSIDNLVEQTGLTAGDVSSMLLILELRSLVVVQPGGLYTLKEGNA